MKMILIELELLAIFVRRMYYTILITFNGWRLRREIAKFRALGKKHGLPSLDEYPDEAIIEGLRRLLADRR